MGFDDRNLIQDVHMDDTLYKTGDTSNLLLDTSKDQVNNFFISYFFITLNICSSTLAWPTDPSFES